MNVDTAPLIQQLEPYIVSAVGGVIIVLGGLLTAWLKKKFNIDIDAAHRDALETATQNIAGQLIARGAVVLEQNGKVRVDNAVVASAANAVIARVPDAIKHFGITPQQVQDRIVAKLPQVLYTPPKS